MGNYSDEVVKAKSKKGKLKHIKLRNNDYKLPRLEFNFSERDYRKKLAIYVESDMYQKAIDVVNNEQRFKKLPKRLEDYYDIACERFPLIEPESVKKILRVGCNEMLWHLKQGENIIIPKTECNSYMKFYKPLFNQYVSKMREVVNKRNYRIKNNFQRKVKLHGI